MDHSYRTVFAVLAVLNLGAIGGANAANPSFQDFFFQVCSGPVGALAQRCAETNAGLGDLSGDSESSLNPTQSLSGSAANLNAARSRNEQARRHGEQTRQVPAAPNSDNELSIGPFSLLLNGRFSHQESQRTQDLERSYKLDTFSAQFGLDRRFNSSLVAGLWLHWSPSVVISMERWAIFHMSFS